MMPFPRCIPIGNAATPYDSAPRFAGTAFDFAGWSGDPSIAALSVNPAIDVMCQEPTKHLGSKRKRPQCEAASLIYRFAQIITTTVPGSSEHFAPLVVELTSGRTGIVLSAGGPQTSFG